MRFIFYHITCFLVLTFSYSGNAHAQIDKTNADTVVTITPDTSIHVFYTNTTGSLKARDMTSGTVTFEWFKDSVGGVFSKIPFSTQQLITNLQSGGYKLHIKGLEIDTTSVAWVFVDSLNVSFEKGSDDYILYNRYTCDFTNLVAESWSQSNFIFYNAKREKQTLPIPTFVWESNSSPAINISTSTGSLRLDTTKGMPYEKATFYVHLKDKFGATSAKDFAFYKPIVTKAIIDTTGSKPVVDGKNSAPFTITFLNKSKNGASYTWKFPLPPNDTAKRKDTTSITRTFNLTSPNDTTPYKIYLVSQSLQRCVDTTSIDILVSQGEIGRDKSEDNPWPDLPNVFYPDGDNAFKFYNISILQFRITIYSRWGKPVYKTTGNNMLEWEGWNGRIHNTGPKASDGIYYYVLEVISYDKNPDQAKMNPSGKYSGFFYLFRKK